MPNKARKHKNTKAKKHKNTKARMPTKNMRAKATTDNQAQANIPETTITGKKYVVINENNPAVEAKIKIIWLVVIVLSIGLLIFWFWTLKNNLNRPFNDKGLTELSRGIESTITDIAANLKDTKKNIDEQQKELMDKQELEKIKEEVLKQIQLNLDSSSWPQHTSANLGLSLQYPADWQKYENNKSLDLKIFNATDAKTNLAGQITIIKTANPKNIPLIKWLEAKKDELKNYSTDDKIFYLDRQPALKYILKNSGRNFDWLVFIGFNKNIYQISAAVNEGGGLYEPVIDKILSTIKFVK
ncbi:hypothetical protein HZA71_02165 [Candidatus Falkowbacteria bacterium]|nr:hypothetical protein [Candidatus Falkowbacteria bacterium]